MQPTDDSALLRDYCENQSHEAFAELVTRHINLVYSVAVRHVGNPHHAEEITQAVFIILAKKAAALRHDKALSSWLFQATHLTANNFVRSEMRRARREQEAYMQSTLNESDAGLWKEIAPLLDIAVARLAEKDRRAIVLRFYEGRNLREVGAALGANEEAAKKRISRALEKLRTAFAKRGVTGTAETIAGTISANSIQAAPATLAKVVTAAAVVKGVTASASILTLTKGALKIMAWTKTKTAVVAGAVVLLATAGLAPHVWRYHLAPDAWRNRFDAAYQLKNGENVRYVKPPFISERMQYYRWRDPEMAAMFRGQPTHISFLQDAEGQPYPDQVGSGPPKNDTLKFILESIGFNLKQYEIEGPDDLLNLNLHGDWVYRDGVSRESLLTGLEPVLRKATGRDIRFQKRTVERDVIVVHGRLASAPDKRLQIYIENASDRGLQNSGTFGQFLDELGNELNIRLINETQDASSNEIARLSWETHRDVRELFQNNDHRMEPLDEILNHVAGQTGLTFTHERRPEEVWFVTEQK